MSGTQRIAITKFDDVAALEVAVVARNDRDRLCSAKSDARGEVREQRQQNRHERIDVRNRVPGEPSEGVGGGVSLPERRVTVGVLVRDH